MILGTQFYFLRHAAAAGNRDRDSLTWAGMQQATRVRDLVRSMGFATVCSSPLQRAQETKAIVLRGASYTDIPLDGLKENVGAAMLLLEADQTTLTEEEKRRVDDFLHSVQTTIDLCLEKQLPILVISHGGIFLALRRTLNLRLDEIDSHMHDGIIDNCHLVRISKDSDGNWGVRSAVQTAHPSLMSRL